ncbi:MAG: hypothetical protein JW929_12110 [Anaerolineales bacterium]|nr:hypothetical protein [Anaerolineales bacterium]
MKRLSRVFPILLASILLAACSAQPATKTAASPEQDSGPKVSFASPEPGATLPLGPIQLMILSEDVRGTAEVEILVNGVPVATVPSPDTTQNSVIVDYVWTPSAPGNYVLQAHGKNNAGTWGSFASLEMTVGDALPAEETPDDAPTAEPIVEETDVIATPEAPTETPIIPDVTPSPTRSGITLNYTFTTYQMYKYGSNCEPQFNSVIVTVSGIDKNVIGGVMVFFNPTDASTGQQWTWQVRNLEAYESGAYGFKFSTANMVAKGKAFPFIPSIVLYQFAITDKSNQPIYRSEVYNNLQVLACGK